MGRGDKRTKKGKIFMGSFGVSRLARPHQSNKDVNASQVKDTDKVGNAEDNKAKNSKNKEAEKAAEVAKAKKAVEPKESITVETEEAPKTEKADKAEDK